MEYHINVSLNGVYLFCTKGLTKWRLEKAIGIFREKFPESEGYKIRVTECNATYREINVEDI